MARWKYVRGSLDKSKLIRQNDKGAEIRFHIFLDCSFKAVCLNSLDQLVFV